MQQKTEGHHDSDSVPNAESDSWTHSSRHKINIKLKFVPFKCLAFTHNYKCLCLQLTFHENGILKISCQSWTVIIMVWHMFNWFSSTKFSLVSYNIKSCEWSSSCRDRTPRNKPLYRLRCEVVWQLSENKLLTQFCVVKCIYVYIRVCVPEYKCMAWMYVCKYQCMGMKVRWKVFGLT